MNAVLSKYAIASTLSKASKQQLSSQFSPLSESWLVHARPEPAVMNRGEPPAAGGGGVNGEGDLDVEGHHKGLPSVREVLVDVMKTQSKNVALGEPVDDMQCEDAVRSLSAALVAAEIRIELQPPSRERGAESQQTSVLDFEY